MRPLRIAIGLLVFVVSPSTQCHAGMLATAPAQSRPDPEKMWCSIVNVDRTPRVVFAHIVDYAGVVVNTGSKTLLPSEALAVGDISGDGAYCRFNVDGSTKKFRAAAIYDDGSTYTVSIPAQ